MLNIDDLVENLRRVRPRGKGSGRRMSAKEREKHRRNYKCDYCKQKFNSNQLSVSLTNFHRVRRGETVGDVAYDFHVTEEELLKMNEKILTDKDWDTGLMINVPEGKLNLFLNRNGVVSCRSCRVERNKLNLTHPEYVYHLLDERQKVREDVTREFRQRVFKRDGFKCHYCEIVGEKTQGRLTLDHKKPVVNGGQTTMENSITSCYRHNKMKGAMPYGRFTDQLKKGYYTKKS